MGYNEEEYNFTPNPLLNSCIVSIPAVKEEQYQFVIQFLLDICCIPHVDKASINETYFEEVPVKVAAVKKDEKKDEKKMRKKRRKKKNQKLRKLKKKEIMSACLKLLNVIMEMLNLPLML